MESLAFDTLTFDHPAACRPARLTASLHLPEADRPVPCMVILTSSAGVQRHREHYYAQALNDAGVAALCLQTASKGAHLNVLINTQGLADKKTAEKLSKEATALYEEVSTGVTKIVAGVESSFGA